MRILFCLYKVEVGGEKKRESLSNTSQVLIYLEIQEGKNYHCEPCISHAYFLSFHKQDNFNILFIVFAFFSLHKTEKK